MAVAALCARYGEQFCLPEMSRLDSSTPCRYSRSSTKKHTHTHPHLKQHHTHLKVSQTWQRHIKSIVLIRPSMWMQCNVVQGLMFLKTPCQETDREAILSSNTQSIQSWQFQWGAVCKYHQTIILAQYQWLQVFYTSIQSPNCHSSCNCYC